MSSFIVDILTPDRVLVRNRPAESLLVPTLRGQINLLKGHTHLITRLSTGLLSIFGGPDDLDEHFSVTTGIGRVLGEKISILASVAESSQEIDEQRAQRALENALAVLKEKTLSSHEFIKYTRKVERAKLRLQIVKKRQRN